MLGMHEDVLVISDLQAPFQHKDSIAFLEAVAGEHNPTRIICIGDEVDYHAISDYDHDPDGYSAGHELVQALKFMRKLYELFPNCDSVISNHTSRPFRKAYKHGIPVALMRTYKEALEAPDGWNWHDYIVIDDVRYEHGDAIGGGGATAMKRFPLRNGQSTVFGHFHAHAGVIWQANPRQLMFGMNVGCLINRKAYAFKYWRAPERPIISVGMVKKGIPTLIPMQLKNGGRWTRKL